jgi:hypothetical protein
MVETKELVYFGNVREDTCGLYYKHVMVVIYEHVR